MSNSPNVRPLGVSDSDPARQPGRLTESARRLPRRPTVSRAARALIDPPLIDLIHPVPRGRLVYRVDHLAELGASKRVIHLGCVDSDFLSANLYQGQWLHERLAKTARELVGIDLDEADVQLLRTLGFEAYAADCCSRANLAALRLPPADVVIAGELIEHLDAPGAFLDAVKCLVAENGKLVMTTPNATALTNFVAALLGKEYVNPDHVAWHSCRTLTALLERHGWSVTSVAYYADPPNPVSFRYPRRVRAATRLFNAYVFVRQTVIRRWHGLADGLIVSCSPTGNGTLMGGGFR